MAKNKIQRIDQEIANYEKQLRQHYSVKAKLAALQAAAKAGAEAPAKEISKTIADRTR